MVYFNSTPKCPAEDKGLIHTGMYLRPNLASSLQRIIRNNLVQERAQFTVAKSQVHPNGLCEIVVKKNSPDISTVTIMEMLQRCRDCVKDSSPASPSVADSNKTIDISDGDDSVCILSPANSASNFRKRLSMPKRPSFSSLSSISNIQGINESFNGITKLPTEGNEASERQSIYDRSTLSMSPGSDTTLRIPDSPSTQTLDIVDSSSRKNNETSILPLSLEPKRKSPIKRPLPEELKSAPASKKMNLSDTAAAKSDDPSSSILILDVSVDTLPSAPTVSSSKETSLSKIQVTRNVSYANSQLKVSVAGLDNIRERKQESEPLYSNVLKGGQNTPSEPSSSGKLVENPGVCEVTTPVKSHPIIKEVVSEGSSDSSLLHKKVDKSVESVPTVSGQREKPVTLSTACLASGKVHLNSVTEVPKIIDIDPQSETCISDQQSTSSESSPESSSSEESHNEIIIEKEVKNESHSNTILIDDSDDDILVCEVLPTSNQKGKLSKAQKKKEMRKKNLHSKIPAGSVFVASTSEEPAADFIPLKPSWRRVDPKPCQNNKQSKLKRIQDKKMKKSEALKRRQLIGNGTQNRRSESQNRRSESQHRRSESQNRRSESPRRAKNTSEKHEYDGNIMNPNSGEPKAGLRPVIIDASNVAVGHGRGRFSVAGLQICIKYFADKGHKVFAFAPKYRRFQVSPEERQILDKLETDGVLSFTPSRTLQSGKKLASYDDRFIVQTAAELGGVVVSTDNFRDLLEENEAWRETIEKRLLMFTWVQDMLLFPNDPLGRHGPHLKDFLRFPNQPEKRSESQASTSSSA